MILMLDLSSSSQTLQCNFHVGRSLPAWTNIQTEFKCILDLATLSKELLKLNPEFYPFPASGTGKSKQVTIAQNMVPAGY